MNSEKILGRKEDVAAILKALGIKEGDKPQQPEHTVGFSPRDIVEASGDNGTSKTQKGWVEYFNSRNEVMISMPDLYYAGKSKDRKLLGVLQKDFKDIWEVTSTRLIYQPDDLNVRVVHYFGSTVIEPVEIELLVPYYSERGLVREVLDDPLGLAFLQTIFGTEDDKEDILETLVNLSGKKEGNIKVWTPNQKGRKKIPERQLLCGGIDSIFHVDSNDISCNGRSCVVQK